MDGKGNAVKTRYWVILLGALLALSLGLSVLFMGGNEVSTHAEILSEGKRIETVDLRIDREFVVETQRGGRNVITVKDGAIAVTEANCPDHYCMHRGFCSGGTQIVCLPNALVIQFTGAQELDAVVG